jgi:calcium-dependent protein kinase
MRGFATSVVAVSTVIAATATVAEAEPSKKGYDFPPVWFGLARGINDQYIINEEIGKGSYGNVHMCMHKKEKKHYAVKILDKKKLRNAESIEDIDRELEMLRLIQGQANIITLKGSFEDAEKVYLVMELCEGGDLYDHIDRFQGKFTESDVAEIVSQILAALAHCHLKGVVICDIKPDNFLFDKQGVDATLKAIDFGLSRRFTPGRPLRRAGGTAYFVAPEVSPPLSAMNSPLSAMNSSPHTSKHHLHRRESTPECHEFTSECHEFTPRCCGTSTAPRATCGAWA